MAKTRGELLTTDIGQIVGKSQTYALLVDSAGAAILDVGGNEQIVELQAVGGRLKVDIGSLASEPFVETDLVAGEFTFSQPMNGFTIINNGVANLTFTINGDTFTLKPSQGFQEKLSPFTVVAIASTGALSFVAYGLL